MGGELLKVFQGMSNSVALSNPILVTNFVWQPLQSAGEMAFDVLLFKYFNSQVHA